MSCERKKDYRGTGERLSENRRKALCKGTAGVRETGGRLSENRRKAFGKGRQGYRRRGGKVPWKRVNKAKQHAYEQNKELCSSRSDAIGQHGGMVTG